MHNSGGSGESDILGDYCESSNLVSTANLVILVNFVILVNNESGGFSDTVDTGDSGDTGEW